MCHLALCGISTLVASVTHVLRPTPLVAPSVHPAACWHGRISLGRNVRLSTSLVVPSVCLSSVVMTAPVETKNAAVLIFSSSFCHSFVCLYVTCFAENNFPSCLSNEQ